MTEEKAEYGTDKIAIAEKRIASVVQFANQHTIKTTEDYERAGEGLKSVKAVYKAIDAEIVEPWRKQKASAEAERKRLTAKYLDPLTEAESIFKRKQITWYTEQERIRQAEESRLRAEADARAEKERQRLAKEAEKLKTPELKEQRMAEAEAVQAAPITLAPSAPAIKGQSFRKTWKAKITDQKAAVKAIIEWPDAPAYIDIKQGEMDKFANRTKGKAQVEGVEWYEETILASASK